MGVFIEDEEKCFAIAPPFTPCLTMRKNAHHEIITITMIIVHIFRDNISQIKKGCLLYV